MLLEIFRGNICVQVIKALLDGQSFFFLKEMFQHCIFIVKFCDFARVFPFLINNEVLTWKQETFT